MKNSKYLGLLLIFFSQFLFGQINQAAEHNQMIAKEIGKINSLNSIYPEYDLFSKNNEPAKSTKYTNSVSEITVLNLNKESLNLLIEAAPDILTMSVPFQNKNIKLELYRQSVFTADFTAMDETGKIIDYTPGEYYRGIIKGEPSSLVAISFFKDDVMGIISNNESGNIVLGKSVDKQDYIAYAEHNLLSESPFKCGADELEYNQARENTMQFNPEMSEAPQTNKCVRIYYEIAYKPYVENNKDLQQTLNWLSGIQNNISTLYQNDDISIVLHQVKVWTKADPYTGDYSYNLNKFRQTVTSFDGDLAHLINYPSSTSVAYLESLCSSYNYAYSGINMTYNQVPTYSWTINAMSHEMGHALGSPHTHACAWNGNNTAIDGCGDQAGYGEGCSGPIPYGTGGTIMSYCHLIGGVGVNFNNGFGEQPAQRIRNFIDSRSCLSGGCSGSYTVTVSGGPAAGGTVSGGGTFNYGHIATVKAVPATGYYLKNWKENGTVVSTDKKYSFVVNSNKNMVAKFAEGYLITTKSSPADGGSTTGDGGYTNGSNATVKAVANTGYKFESWNEGGSVVSTNKNYKFTVSGARTLTAKFSKIKYDITVKASPANGGTVTGGGSYNYNATVTVKATPKAGYLFKHWKAGGTIVSTSANYQHTVTGKQTLTAVFVSGYLITTKSSPAAGGTTTGGGEYETGKTAKLKAVPNPGYVFSSWKEGSAVVATTPKYNFTVTAKRTLKAFFTKASYTIVTKSAPVAGGTTSGDGSYVFGKNVTVKAVANAGYVFESWLEGSTVVSTNKNYSFSVSGNRTLKAKFKKDSSARINATPNFAEAGIIQGSGEYEKGGFVILSATSNPGYSFSGWAENGKLISTDSELSFRAEGDRNLTALFDRNSQIDIDKMSLSAYPNPFSDFVMLDAGETEIKSVEFYDLSGRLISVYSINNMSKYQLDTRNLSSGTYLMKVYTAKETKTIKVYKK